MTAVTPERRGADRVTSSTVLVADDSRAVRQILRRALERAGYRVEEAADGRQAVEACRDVDPDLVLLDVDMPVMDGMAALAAIRADDALRSIPVLFLTARTGGEDVALGLDLGAQDYLRKPCDPAELTARVASALRLRERERALARKALEADEASTLDPLTGLGNRRFLQARTSELAARGGLGATAGVALVDVDHFKRINDEHGHPVGDVVLCILARRLATAVGADATLVRWGGEEFLALAPDLSTTPLADLGEHLRASVVVTPFSVGGHDLLPVTVSVGCASGALDAFEAVLRAADGALYEAKRSGRNRVALAPLPPPDTSSPSEPSPIG